MTTITTVEEVAQYPKGTLFLTEDGTVYRLRYFSTDWESDDLAVTLPDFSVQNVSGTNGAVTVRRGDTLPALTVVWTPKEES